MTPDQWGRVNELFEAAVRLDAAERNSWLEQVCSSDAQLRAEVDRLLAHDERVNRDLFLRPPEGPGPDNNHAAFEPASRAARNAAFELETVDLRGAQSPGPFRGFTPKAAIAAGERMLPMAYSPSVMRSRLRELAIIYIVMFAMTMFWRHVIMGPGVLGPIDFTVLSLNILVIAILASTAALLSDRRTFSLPVLKSLELGIIGMIAAMVTCSQYRFMLAASLRDDPMMAQLTMKNIVLLMAVVMLTFGLYVPKSWRRAATVVAPLALLPFATLLVLYVRHPDAMDWLGQGWRKSDTARLMLFSFDAMLLALVAVGSAYGAYIISGLRRQVAEARQLGQYRLRARIGAGGMGEVYLAEHEFLKRPCAVKLIRPGDVADPHALARFEREVHLTATLSHPNTVEIYDYGRAEDGTYYYVMEYLPGLSLAELVERHGPLQAARVVYLLRQVCLALREAHAAGLIHRDIKPSNIFAARRGGMDDVAKLLDFGLVRPADADQAPHLSEEGQVLGTPLFMAPEQAMRGRREVDERSDIYSLGAVAYYLLTGRPTFDGEGAIEVLVALARDPVIPPSQVRSDSPSDLERVVLRCLAKEPDERFPDAGSLERALGACDCAVEWDAERAAQWWQDMAQSSVTPVAVA
jgi:serine/threonine-protein kinase